MTPKENAKRIVDKYRTFVVMWAGGTAVENENVKQCALIAVDEVISSLINTGGKYNMEYENAINKDIVFLERTKEEIQKL